MNILFSTEKTPQKLKFMDDQLTQSNKKKYRKASISSSTANEIKDKMRIKFIEENFPYNILDYRCSTQYKSGDDTDNYMTDVVIFVEKIMRI